MILEGIHHILFSSCISAKHLWTINPVWSICLHWSESPSVYQSITINTNLWGFLWALIFENQSINQHTTDQNHNHSVPSGPNYAFTCVGMSLCWELSDGCCSTNNESNPSNIKKIYCIYASDITHLNRLQSAVMEMWHPAECANLAKQRCERTSQFRGVCDVEHETPETKDRKANSYTGNGTLVNRV